MATSPDLDVAPAPSGGEAAPAHGTRAGLHPFEVRLTNFTGPFDLLLHLVAKHRLDITEIALAEVTDEFIAHIHAAGEWDLSRASEFLVVAATLLDLKAARLLPRGTVEDEEDLELLEARDLLFARLLQYRAFKEVATLLADQHEAASRRHPRDVPLEPHLAALLPELVVRIGPDGLAALAAAAFAPRSVPHVALDHLHAPPVSVAEQADLLAERLRRTGHASFVELTRDAGTVAVVVARFLAVLDLFHGGLVALEQAEPLGELTVRWAPDPAVEDVGVPS